MFPLLLATVKSPPAPVNPAVPTVAAFRFNVLPLVIAISPVVVTKSMFPPLPLPELTLIEPICKAPLFVVSKTSPPAIPAPVDVAVIVPVTFSVPAPPAVSW